MSGEVLELDNPFFHRVARGENVSWVSEDTVKIQGSTLKDRGAIELEIKEGWSARFRLTSTKWGAFGLYATRLDEDTLVELANWEAADTGAPPPFDGGSEATFTLRTGSEIKVSDATDDLFIRFTDSSEAEHKRNLPNTSANFPQILKAAGGIGVVGLANRAFNDEDLEITLLVYERVGQAAGETNTSETTKEGEIPEIEPRLITSGPGYTVRVGVNEEGDVWTVYLNGMKMSAYDTEADAVNRAIEIGAEEEAKGYEDPESRPGDDKPDNALQATFGGFMLALPYVVGIVAIGFAVRWITTKILGGD